MMRFYGYVRMGFVKQLETPLHVKYLENLGSVLLIGFVLGVILLAFFFISVWIFTEKLLTRFFNTTKYRPYDTLVGRDRKELALEANGP
jgi:hypothetical protein